MRLIPSVPFGLPAMLLVGAFACGGPAVAPVTPRQSTGPRPAGVSPLPRELPGYRVIDTTVYEEANSGLSFRYEGANGFHPDVFVYPHLPQGALCRGACRDEAARAEASAFRDLFPSMIERGYYDSITVTGDEALLSQPTSWLGNGRHLTLRGWSQGRKVTSHFYVWAGQETILKIRATYPTGTIPDQEVKAFAGEIVRTAAPLYTCAAGTSQGQMISANTTLARPAKEIIQTVDSILQATAVRADYRAADRGAWRTAPSFGWPAGTAAEAWSRTTNPGYVLFVRVQPAGDSLSLTIGAQSLCAAVPGDSTARRAEELLPVLAATLTLGGVIADSIP